MNKSNLEIIQESIFEFFNVREKIPEGNKEEGQITVFCQLVTLNELSDFASNLLKKLNIPEEGEVIAEGVVRNNLVGGITLNDKEENYIFAKNIIQEKALNYKGKKIQLIIREVK